MRSDGAFVIISCSPALAAAPPPPDDALASLTGRRDDRTTGSRGVRDLGVAKRRDQVVAHARGDGGDAVHRRAVVRDRRAHGPRRAVDLATQREEKAATW